MTTPSVNEKGLFPVLTSDSEPSRASAFSASLTFFWRAMLKIKHVPEQMFDVTASPIMFLLMFTYLFGGAIAGSTGDYLQFVLPGILVMTVAFITIYTGLGINNDIKKGVFDRFRSLPIWQPALIVGALLGDTVRYIVASAVVIGLGLILGFRPDGGVVGVLLSVLLLLVFFFQSLVDMDCSRTCHENAGISHGCEYAYPVSADLYQQCLCISGDNARLARSCNRC